MKFGSENNRPIIYIVILFLPSNSLSLFFFFSFCVPTCSLVFVGARRNDPGFSKTMKSYGRGGVAGGRRRADNVSSRWQWVAKHTSDPALTTPSLSHTQVQSIPFNTVDQRQQHPEI